jgi:hypothetical protein
MALAVKNAPQSVARDDPSGQIASALRIQMKCVCTKHTNCLEQSECCAQPTPEIWRSQFEQHTKTLHLRTYIKH